MMNIESFKRIFSAIPGEPEFCFEFLGSSKKYMLIKYSDHVSFQRCGYKDDSGEYDYSDIDSLMKATSVDGISLLRDWNHVTRIVVNDSLNLDDSADLRFMVEEREPGLNSLL